MVIGVKMNKSALIINKSFEFGVVLGSSPSLDNFKYELKGYKPTIQISRKSKVSKHNPIVLNAAQVNTNEVITNIED